MSLLNTLRNVTRKGVRCMIISSIKSVNSVKMFQSIRQSGASLSADPYKTNTDFGCCYFRLLQMTMKSMISRYTVIKLVKKQKRDIIQYVSILMSL